MKTIIAVLAALAVMSFATTALAQPSIDGYSDTAGQIQTQIKDDGGTPPPSAPATVTDPSGSTLPFTGLDVALLVGAGGLLVGAGFGMRRLTRPPGNVA
jgi:hypothetical protein